MAITATNIITNAQALVNDTAGSIATSAVMLLHVKNAVRDLQDLFARNGINFLEEETAAQTITAGNTVMNTQPTNILWPTKLVERQSGSTVPEDYVEVERKEPLPNESANSTKIKYWEWREGVINFIASSTDRQIKLYYIKSYPAITAGGDDAGPISAENYLSYRTAELFARFSTRDIELAEMLKVDREAAEDNLIGSNVRNEQGMPQRQKPYRR